MNFALIYRDRSFCLPERGVALSESSVGHAQISSGSFPGCAHSPQTSASPRSSCTWDGTGRSMLQQGQWSSCAQSQVRRLGCVVAVVKVSFLIICKHACSQNGRFLPPSKLSHDEHIFCNYASKGLLKSGTMLMGNAVDGFEQCQNSFRFPFLMRAGRSKARLDRRRLCDCSS